MDALTEPRQAPVPAAAAAPTPRRAPVGGFLGGVFLSQISNDALHLAQPLLMVQLSGSLGFAAFFSSFDTAVHMAGTVLGGWPGDRFGARRLLIVSTFSRALALALIPAAWAAGWLTLPWAMGAYTLDAFIRGFIDTSAHALPIGLAAGDRGELDRINSSYEFIYDVGGIAGPALLGALLLAWKGVAAHALIPLGFAAAAGVFLAIPAERSAPARRGPAAGGGTLAGLRLILTDRRLRIACLGIALLNLYPLRKLMSAFFAKAILGQPAAAGWLGAAFGLGGAAGSLLYRRFSGRGAGTGWIVAGAFGLLALAAAWAPGRLAPMMAGAFVFALLNVGARLAMTGRLQQATPAQVAGGVTAVSRFGANAVSVVLKALLGLAFTVGAGPRVGFALVGAGLVLLAFSHLRLASRLASPGEPLALGRP